MTKKIYKWIFSLFDDQIESISESFEESGEDEVLISDPETQIDFMTKWLKKIYKWIFSLFDDQIESISESFEENGEDEVLISDPETQIDFMTRMYRN